MRKRTQLVGFEFGYWKHVQYCAEFIDNALDAIEEFQWKELVKPDSKVKFSLDQELFLEKFSILETAKEEKKTQQLDNEAKHTLMQELGIEVVGSDKLTIKDSEVEKEESGEIINKEELEVEVEVKRIIEDFNELIKPVEFVLDVEPIVIVRIREFEAASFLTTEISQKNVMSYTFEIFDNGTGISKIDLRKFGKYLASSKSVELKQTRGSQGFGAPSAFSDAQNTTGKPIIVVSKSLDNIYGNVSEFFTTSKNEKKYLIHPTDIDCPFLHGTYIKLNYLNVKYIRGFVETYIEETAFMNPHITVIYIDPYGKEKIYRRLASSFPKEPKYAKPHPSSTNIGDLQDLITKSEKKNLSAFLQDNFVRVSSKTAKDIIDIAEKDLQDKFNLLILKDGFITRNQKSTDPIYFLRNEKRVFGRSEKPRDKLIVHQVESNDLKENYWEVINEYNTIDSDFTKYNKKIRKLNDRIEKTEIKKEIKNIERKIKNYISDIEGIEKQKEKLKNKLNDIFKNQKEGLLELKKIKNRTDFEDLLKKVQISQARPTELTKEQFNSLFLAFKSIKYMAPPTDTAIPVGEAILENTLIKELGLKVSENLDDFDTPVENVNQTIELLQEEKKFNLKKEDPKVKEEILNNISIPFEEVISINSEILNSIQNEDKNHNLQEFKTSVENILSFSETESIDSYSNVFEYFIENYSRDDDFVAAETRNPTSGKGLAYVVEAVLAYSKDMEVPKRSRDVLSRFVNRTPKLRDSADCAITKAVQSVNWKNYNLDTYDNGLPKGPIKLLVNISGPFVHLMFKSQSKNALADDEDLIKEIKYCLEAIGRKLRVYLNRRETIHKREKRASLIEQYIPIFTKSVYNIVSQGNSIYKYKIKQEELEDLMKNAIGKKITPSEPPRKKIEVRREEPKEVEFEKEKISMKTLQKMTFEDLRDYCEENHIELPSKIKKDEIIKFIQEYIKIEPEIEKLEPKIEIETPIIKTTSTKSITPDKSITTQIAKPLTTKSKSETLEKKKEPIQTKLPIITTEAIHEALSNEWQTIKHLIFKLKIKDMMDARYLQVKLKELERKEEVLVDIKMGKKHWKLK